MTSQSSRTSLKFGSYLRDHLATVETANEKVLEEASALLHDVIGRDGLIFTAGSGHSTAMVLETFYRAGGLACVYPVTHPAVSPLEGGQASTLFERTEGLAEILIKRANPTADDVAIIFSNSGVNAFPVELAHAMRERETPVISFVSGPHMSRVSPRVGTKLGEVSNIVLDTNVPYGDAVFEKKGQSMIAISSVVTIYLWNMLLARLADRADASDTKLPIWTSANTEGGDERNTLLLDRYSGRIPLVW